MDKNLGALLHFWSVFQFRQVQPLPSPHKQCWTRVSRIFSDFQLCVGWGRENCKKISKTLHCFKREPRNNRKYEYCSIVPRTFVQDCSNEIRAGAGREKQYGRITFTPKKKRFCCHSLEYCSPITMPLYTRDNDGKSETLALIQNVPQQRSHENERRKDIDVMFHLYRLCENINSWRIRSRLRRVMRHQASILSSATVVVQRHQVKSLWSKPRLKLGPTPPWRRNNQWEGASAMFSFDGTYFKCRRTLKR